MKSTNKGFTLVELVVVMAILGIMTAYAGLNVSISNSANANRCASSVNLLISKCRAGCLGRSGDVHLTISLDSNGNIVGEYYENGAIVSTDTFAGTGISVSYTSTLPSTMGLETGTPLTLSFDRSTGGQKPQPDGSYCTAISFTNGRTFTIELVPSTGNHKLT